MSGMVGRTAATEGADERQLRAEVSPLETY